MPADKQSYQRIAECRYHGRGFELRANIPPGYVAHVGISGTQKINRTTA